MSVTKKVSVVAGVAIAAAASIPTVPAYADNARNSQWYLRSLRVSEAQTLTKGSGVVVAVVDTGTYPHPDIRRNLLRGFDETDGEKGNGQVDADGHGTRMASIIAGHGHSAGDGTLGIAPQAKILPVRVSKTGAINDNDELIAKGIRAAANQGVKVINVSIAVGPQPEMMDAVNAAISNGIVVVAGIGNRPDATIPGYPAAMDDVLGVGATGRDGKYAPLSIKSKQVDICAPGIDIASAKPKNKYALGNGTSDSTAIVSGAVALVLAKFPDLPPKEVIHRLTATADDIGAPGQDDECGYGRLNIVKALTADVPPLEGSSAGATPSSAAATTPVNPATVAPTTADTAPEIHSAGSSAPLIFGGLAGLVVAGGLVAILFLRRRRHSS